MTGGQELFSLALDFKMCIPWIDRLVPRRAFALRVFELYELLKHFHWIYGVSSRRRCDQFSPNNSKNWQLLLLYIYTIYTFSPFIPRYRIRSLTTDLLHARCYTRVHIYEKSILEHAIEYRNVFINVIIVSYTTRCRRKVFFFLTNLSID